MTVRDRVSDILWSLYVQGDSVFCRNTIFQARFYQCMSFSKCTVSQYHCRHQPDCISV